MHLQQSAIKGQENTKVLNDNYYIIMKISVLFFFPLLFVACVSNSKYEKAINTIDSLKTENARLTQLNEELENGESRLAALYTQFVKQEKYIKAEDVFSKAIARHPQASTNKAYNNISHIRERAQIQRDSIEKAVRDSLFLANIDDIGEWKIGNYVNDFKEPTGEHYVYQVIYGHFSNSATSRSGLRVTISINKSSDSSSGIGYSIAFDEYDDGTIDRRYLSDTKIVCSDLRKVFVFSYGYALYNKDEGTDSKEYTFLDLLRLENSFEVTDTHRNYSSNTIYSFTVNSQNLNNALVKAGILSVDDVINHK